MKIVLFGMSGQIGRELQRALAPMGELVTIGRGQGVDFAKAKELADTIRYLKPNIIVNAAAYTSVDMAEAEPELANLVNADAPRVLAHEAANLGAWLIHYSSDYVFDGSGTMPWLEMDAPAPLNVYGVSKLAGEHAIQQSGCRHLIFRTSWVYSVRGNNFLKTMLKLAAERETLSVVNDQIGAPTSAVLLADVTAHALKAALEDDSLSGLYHVAAAGETSWHDYAKVAIEFARKQKGNLKVTSIRPVASADFPAKAKRPLNSRLGTNRLCGRFALTLPHWQLEVERTIVEILKMPTQ